MFKGFYRRNLETGEVEYFQFSPEHFQEAGFSASLAGMPILESHQLVNKWNMNQDYPMPFVYVL